MTFAAIDRARGQGTTWAAIGALITIAALFATSPHVRAKANALLVGLACWFAALTVASWIFDSPTGWFTRYGRAIASGGYALIILASLAVVPISEYYARSRTRSVNRNTDEFRNLNVRLTRVWGAAFALIAVSSALGPIVNSRPGFTVFNWVIPLAVAAVAGHRTKLAWDEFNDDDLLEGIHEHFWELGRPPSGRQP
jgi:hypothetical protein